jgi:hypothetical protein
VEKGKRPWPCVGNFPVISLEGLTKTKKISIRTFVSQSNRTPCEYNSDHLISVSEGHTASIFGTEITSILDMEAVCSLETPVTTYHTA